MGGITRTSLVVSSLMADGLDLIGVGQIPVLSWVIDVPILLMHLRYAGVHGFFTIAELIPGVGTLPIFTIAALGYEDPH
jgi:hypothetical protein